MSKRKVFSVTTPYDQLETIPLGFAGENLARTVEWDIGPWVETYGEGEVQLLAKRPVDKDPYPVVVTRDGNSVLWTVRKEDLWAGNEEGRAQLFYLVDGQVVARSKAFRTMTREAIEGDVQECSEPERDWVEQVLQSVAAAEESAGAAEISAESAVKSAEAASISEEITGMYAEEAKEIVTGAEKTMEEFAATAVEKATIASESAVKAQNAASTASMAAGNAQTAQEKAEEAQVAAENARIATEAAKKAVETTASEVQENIKDQKKLSGAYTISKIKSGEVIAINNSAEYELKNLKLYGKSLQNNTPSLDFPAKIESSGDEKNIVIKIMKQNILPYPYTDGKIKSQNGIIFIVNDDGSIYANGTATGNASFFLLGSYPYNNENVSEGFLSGCPINNGGSCDLRYVNEALSPIVDNGSGVDLSISPNYTGTGYIEARVLSGNTVDVIFYPMIHKGHSTISWEPYYSQTCIYPIANNLLGIAIKGEGNYIDERGQQWICDEVDFGRGKHIQRIGKIDHYTNEDVGDVYMSTTGQLSDGATVIYPLETPIETDLPEEVMDAYHQLTMYYPNTTITTDSYPPAGISVEYIADTKTYIDQKYDSLQKQLDILIGADT